MEDLHDYLETSQLTNWAKASLNIIKCNSKMSDREIRKVIRWVGEYAKDTIYVGGDKPVFGRLGIGMMLTVTLLEFPKYYNRYELAQFN